MGFWSGGTATGRAMRAVHASVTATGRRRQTEPSASHPPSTPHTSNASVAPLSYHATESAQSQLEAAQQPSCDLSSLPLSHSSAQLISEPLAHGLSAHSLDTGIPPRLSRLAQPVRSLCTQRECLVEHDFESSVNSAGRRTETRDSCSHRDCSQTETPPHAHGHASEESGPLARLPSGAVSDRPHSTARQSAQVSFTSLALCLLSS